MGNILEGPTSSKSDSMDPQSAIPNSSGQYPQDLWYCACSIILPISINSFSIHSAKPQKCLFIHFHSHNSSEITTLQFSLVTQSCLTLCNPMNHSMPGLTVHHHSWSPPKPMYTESVMPSNHLILCCPLLPSIFPSIRVFSNESALRIRWSNYWSCSFNISPSNEHPGLISPRMDWLDLLAVQRALKSLLQHHSSKASILLHSAFFISNSHIHTWPLEKPQPWLDGPL